MARILDVHPIEFEHTGTLSAGSDWIPEAVETDTDTVMEVFRMEIFPPVDSTVSPPKREEIREVRIRINNDDYKYIAANELMFPPATGAYPVTAVDLGDPILLEGRRGIYNPCPKVGPRSTLTVRVVAKEEISNPFKIRLWVVEVKGEDTLADALKARGVLTPDGKVDQSFTLVDTERKLVKRAEKTVDLSLKKFPELHGGPEASKPRVMPFITWATNAKATTVNTEYIFSRVDGRVDYDFMNLYFNYNENEALVIKQLGVLSHDNLKYVRVFVSERTKNPWLPASPDQNIAPMPLAQTTDVTVYQGPKRLERPYVIWKAKGYVSMIDNGTSISAEGVKVAVWGTKFEF